MNLSKRTIIASSLSLLLCSSLLASEVYTIKNGSLQDAIKKISKISNMTFMADTRILEGKKAPSIKNISGLKNALKEVLKNTNLEAIIKDKTIIIRKKALTNEQSDGDLGTVDVMGKSSLTDTSGLYTIDETSTATKLSIPLNETPQSISIMSKQRIKDQGLNGLVQVLEQTPGINVQSQGNSRFQIYSRGGYRVSSYQLDGITTFSDTGTQTVAQALVDTSVYDHIEVLRGATGLMTGSGEPSGTINMLRKKPTEEFQGDVDLTIGSWDLYRISADVSGSLNENGSIRGRLVSTYQKNNSFIDFLEEEKKVLYGIVEADISDNTIINIGFDYQEYNPIGQTSVGSLLFYKDLSRTNFDRSHSQAIKGGYDNKKTYNIFASINHNLQNDWQVKASVNYLHTDRKFSFGEAAASLFEKNTGAGAGIWAAKGTAEQAQIGLNLTADGNYTLFGREHELVIGYNYSKYRNEHMTGNEISGVDGSTVNYYNWGNSTVNMVNKGLLYTWNYDVKQSGTYLATRLHPSDDLSLILGGRFSKYEMKDKWDWTTNTSYNSDTVFKEDAITPYVGIVYNLNGEHTIYASYSSIFSPQDYKDKNAKVLDPLEAINYEIGYKNELLNGSLNTSIALYQINQTNLAVEDAANTVRGTTNTAYKAIDGAVTKGLDFEIVGEIIPNWNTQMSYTYAKTKNENKEKINTVFPEHMIKLWTTYKINSLTLGGGVNWQSKIFFDTASWMAGDENVYAEQKSYYLVNLMAAYQINKNLSTKVNINNLFDKKYYNSLDEGFLAGAYGSPRNFTVSLNYKF